MTAVDPDLLVVEDVWGEAFDTLAARLRIGHEPELWRDRGQLAARARNCRGIVVRNRTQVDGELLANLPDLQVVARAGAGLDNIDVAAADRSNVVVVAAPGANAQSVAEHALALALALARGIPGHDRATRSGSWERAAGREIGGVTWGLIGAGATGRAVGRLMSQLGSRVLGYDTALAATDRRLVEAGISLVSLDRVVEESDVISIHVPATAQTQQLVNRDFLARMRRHALLINVARGDVVDEAALADALITGQIGGAGLDVRAHEPPSLGVLETLDNVVLTPHVAGLTAEAQERVVAVLAADLAVLFGGGAAVHAVGAARQLAAAGTALAGDGHAHE
jgi:D-3-phosphoglycerate dehydrogenase/(S)-sulfolactate dehydrogenase